MEQNFTLETALGASQEGRLGAWIQAFLRSPGGNLAMADGLNLEPRSYWGPADMPLDLVGRCCGPEAGMAYPVPLEGFVARVGRIRAALEGGQSLPPLLVNYSEGRLTLNDGNHRHEAHRLLGSRTVPAIFWTTGQAAMDEFLTRFGAALRAPR